MTAQAEVGDPSQKNSKEASVASRVGKGVERDHRMNDLVIMVGLLAPHGVEQRSGRAWPILYQDPSDCHVEKRPKPVRSSLYNSAGER